MKNVGIPNNKSSAFLVIDLQERLMPVIHGKEIVFDNARKLLRGAEVLSLKTIVTEQYPKGLGNICAEIELGRNVTTIEKICFSCMQSEAVLQELKSNAVTDLIICGVEAHICVLKTVLEALQLDFVVHVVADAISSRTLENKNIAIQRMQQAGAYIVSTEMILFMLLDEAGTEEFKAICKLIK